MSKVLKNECNRKDFDSVLKYTTSLYAIYKNIYFIYVCKAIPTSWALSIPTSAHNKKEIKKISGRSILNCTSFLNKRIDTLIISPTPKPIIRGNSIGLSNPINTSVEDNNIPITNDNIDA